MPYFASASTAGSPSVSPTLSPNPNRRRLSARRGSASASDPWGKHAEINFNPLRTSSSRLTILRVFGQPHDDPAPSLTKRQSIGPSNVHRRHGSGPSDSPRLSFANQSFGRPASPSSGRPASPTTTRPASPTTTRPRSPGPSSHRAPFANKKLNPDQLFDLAQQCTKPQYLPRTSAPNTPNPSAPQYAPASFIPLTEEILLPFIDRPAEVSALISNPPTARLFGLLAQALPKATDSTYPPDMQCDPKLWTYAQLDYLLKDVDRDQADDFTWVRKARACVMSHSELIWERIKGALGVPPDIDLDDLHQDPWKDWDSGASDKFSQTSSPIALPQVIVEKSTPDVERDEPPAEDESALDDEPDENAVSIEPVLVPTTPPLVASDSASGLGGITEADEEEEEGGSETPNAQETKEIVQGLRISTAPQPSHSPSWNIVGSPSSGSIALGHSPSQPFSTVQMGTPSPLHLESASPSVSPSVGARALPAEDVYKVEMGTSSEGGAPRRKSRSWSQSSGGSSFRGKDGFYDVVGERGPGNPLFPSSFAHLAMGPTLKANNPALRSPVAPPASVFGDPHSIRTGRRGVPSWARGWDPSKHEYALTVASGSSIA